MPSSSTSHLIDFLALHNKRFFISLHLLSYFSSTMRLFHCSISFHSSFLSSLLHLSSFQLLSLSTLFLLRFQLFSPPPFPLRTHIGITGVQLTLMYVEVTDAMNEQTPLSKNLHLVHLPVNVTKGTSGNLASSNCDGERGEKFHWWRMAMQPTFPLSLSLALLWYGHTKCRT